MSNGADKVVAEKLKMTEKDFIEKIKMSFDIAMLAELKKKEPSISFLPMAETTTTTFSEL